MTKAEEQTISSNFTISVAKDKAWKGLALIAIGIMVLSQFFSLTFAIQPKFNVAKKSGGDALVAAAPQGEVNRTELDAAVLPAEGVQLPIKWGDFGKKMIEDGVIDEQKFMQIFPEGFSDNDQEIFSGFWDEPITLTSQNSRFMLDMLWAFGLANKNDILINGEMTDESYGGDASKFAATGGWTLSKGDPMDHYGMHDYVTLNAEQQSIVDRVSRGIFRPCCGNSTHFPDCNHGMAMLGLLQLMAANGVTEEEMYDIALLVNSYWFPQTYVDLATYFKEQGVEWKDVDAKLVLGQEYSSGQGYKQIRSQIKSLPQPVSGGGGCGA